MNNHSVRHRSSPTTMKGMLTGATVVIALAATGAAHAQDVFLSCQETSRSGDTYEATFLSEIYVFNDATQSFGRYRETGSINYASDDDADGPYYVTYNSTPQQINITRNRETNAVIRSERFTISRTNGQITYSGSAYLIRRDSNRTFSVSYSCSRMDDPRPPALF